MEGGQGACPLKLKYLKRLRKTMKEYFNLQNVRLYINESKGVRGLAP